MYRTYESFVRSSHCKLRSVQARGAKLAYELHSRFQALFSLLASPLKEQMASGDALTLLLPVLSQSFAIAVSSCTRLLKLSFLSSRTGSCLDT